MNKTAPTKAPLSRQLILALIGLTLTSLFWAGNALVARAAVGDIPPFALSFWRWMLPWCVLLPWIIRAFQRNQAWVRANFWRLSGLSVLSISTYNSILYHAALNTPALNITLVSTTLPVATLLLAIPMLGMRPTLRQWLGILIAALGVLGVMTRNELARLLAIEFNPGDVLMLAAVSCWAVYSVWLKRTATNIPSFDFLLLLIGIGAPCIGPFYAWEYQSTGGFSLSASNLGMLAYVAIFPSVLAYWFWNFGVTEAGPSVASVFSYLIPVFTALLAIPILGETPAWYHLTGGFAILSGILLASR